MASDDENEEFSSFKGIPATIIYINCYDPGKFNTAEVAYAATCRLMRQYLRTPSSQYIAVCLYGLEDPNTSVFGIKTVQEIFPLNYPTLQAYKSLQNVNISSLKQSKEFILSDVLWHSRKMFANCKKQLLSRTVIILSRLDIPPSQNDQKPAFKEAVDLSDSNIEVKLINISQTAYDVDEFYKNFLINAYKTQDVDLPNRVWEHKEIEQLMHQQCNRHLAVAKLSFEIGDGLSIGVGVYNLLKGKTGYNATYLDSETNAILTSVNKTLKVRVVEENMQVDSEQEPNAMPLLKSEILHSIVYGGENIEFTDSEKKILRNPFGTPKIKLLGFKPANILCKEKYIFKQCYFLFPNESIIEGSTVAFKAFHQACIETNMVAICVLCTRVNSRPTIVALSPCSNPLGLNLEVGFDVIHLPFMEHMRRLPAIEDDNDIKIVEADKRVMKDILTELKFDYKPEMFENPKMQSLYRALEVLALEGDEIEPFTDTTKQDPKKFDAVDVDLFYEVFGPFKVGVTKKAAQSTDGPRAKKMKTENVDEDSLLQERLDNKKVHCYTVAELKDILKYKECPDLPALTGMKKDQLVNLIYKHLKK